MTGRPPRLLAFYLPQFHPIPENDRWWGKGFTEWTNVVKTKPLFRGHYQPHLPADLGYYDLRLPETRVAQAELAREHGIHGFCYYHYWFHGRRLLERPFQEVLDSGRPDFPFCLCWANENWSRNWDGGHDEVLVRQEYSEADDRRHVEWLLRAFEDPRYLRVDGRPLFLVYRAKQLPAAKRTTDLWREAAQQRGFPDLYLCRVEGFGDERDDPVPLGFDAAVEFQPDWFRMGKRLRPGKVWRMAEKLKLAGEVYGTHLIYDYATVVQRMLGKSVPAYRRFPCVTPSWDNSARRPEKAVLLKDSSPELYERWLSEVLQRPAAGTDDENLVFINAWNEWGEGNHLEPDVRHGRAYLEATRRAWQHCQGRERPPDSAESTQPPRRAAA